VLNAVEATTEEVVAVATVATTVTTAETAEAVTVAVATALQDGDNPRLTATPQ